MLRTVLERLYKRAKRAHNLDNLNGTFVLTPNIVAPTLEEVAIVEAEVGDKAFTRAISAIKKTVRSSAKQRVDTPKVQENKELGQKL
jgi:hypothetical protein